MKTKRKMGAMLLLMLALLLFAGISANAGFQRMANGRYRYYTSKTSYIKGSRTADGELAAKFKNLTYKGRRYTYAFDEKGYMLTGWKVLYATSKDGTAGLGYYYFNKNGQMYKNRSVGDRYFLGNGRMVNGFDKYGNYYGMDGLRTTAPTSGGKFIKSKKGTRYQISKGTYATKTWMCIRTGKKYYWYYFYGTGYMAKSRYVGTHYVDKNGRWVPSKDKK